MEAALPSQSLIRTDIVIKHVTVPAVPAIYDKLELISTDIIVNDVGLLFRIILYYRPPHYNSSNLDYFLLIIQSYWVTLTCQM